MKHGMGVIMVRTRIGGCLSGIPLGCTLTFTENALKNESTQSRDVTVGHGRFTDDATNDESGATIRRKDSASTFFPAPGVRKGSVRTPSANAKPPKHSRRWACMQDTHSSEDVRSFSIPLSTVHTVSPTPISASIDRASSEAGTGLDWTPTGRLSGTRQQTLAPTHFPHDLSKTDRCAT